MLSHSKQINMIIISSIFGKAQYIRAPCTAYTPTHTHTLLLAQSSRLLPQEIQNKRSIARNQFFLLLLLALFDDTNAPKNNINNTAMTKQHKQHRHHRNEKRITSRSNKQQHQHQQNNRIIKCENKWQNEERAHSMESEISVLLVEFQLFVGDDKMIKRNPGASKRKARKGQENSVGNGHKAKMCSYTLEYTKRTRLLDSIILEHGK